jgi:S-disulfanyl-L-cysteine oxidoreductase SoxD
MGAAFRKSVFRISVAAAGLAIVLVNSLAQTVSATPAATKPKQTKLGAKADPLAFSLAKPWAALGRPATKAEIRAWDIDVRPDFKGLPPGAGSVAKGLDVWETQCESCHGAFGESNQVFTPIVGGTSRDDSRTGRTANLTRSDYPQRTTMMKVAYLSTLWDYINRAMPWNAPKSLSTEEVYAVTAYILHLADLVPADFVLSDRNIAEVQARMPNRNGMVRSNSMWTARDRPDVQGSDCMRNCAPAVELRSQLPDYARDSHGNLADQQRLVGPMRGAKTQ